MPKSTYYKGSEQVSMTPEDAKTFQGGNDANPYGGLLRSGWSASAPKIGGGSNLDNGSNLKDPTGGEPKDTNIFSLYGMDGGDVGSGADLYGKYGVKKPEYEEPNTAKYDSLVQKYQPTYDPAAIEENLQNNLSSIKARYDIERADAQRGTENERQSQISGLYDVGVVNPLSSGLASIGTASQAVLDRRLANISAREGAEKSAAEATAYGRKTSEQESALDFATGERDQIEQEAQDSYDRDRQSMADSIDLINGVVSAWKSGRTADRQDKEDAKQGIQDLVEKGGYSIFEGMTADDISDLESSTGYPAGTMNKWAEKLKQTELEAQKSKKNEYEMRTIDGSLYLIYPNQLDENGLPKKELFIKKTKSGSTSKADKMTDDFKKWYYETFNSLAFEDDPDTIAEWERWQATGKGAKDEGEWMAVGKDKVLVKGGKEVNRIKGGSGDGSNTGDMTDDEFLEFLGVPTR